MRRILLALLALAGLVALVLAPRSSAVDSPAEALEVSSAVLACPELAVTDDSASVLSGLVAAAPGDEAAGSTSLDGTAALRRIDQERDLARVTAVAEPVTLSVATRSSAPILMLGSGSWAPAAVAGVASREIAGVGAGIASAACPTPGPEWWFVGSGSQLGRGAALLVSNPAQEPARFDITLFAEAGPVEALAGKGIDLGPQSYVRLRLDALAQDQDLLAVQVRASAGRVAAALRDVAVAVGADSRGVDFLPPAVPPTTQLWVGAIPGGAARQSLVLVNPATQFATVRAQLLTSAGLEELDGRAPMTVPAGSVTSLPVAALIPDEGGTLALSSDLPVTAAVQSSWGGDEAGDGQEVSWLAATPPISAPNTLAGAAAVPAGKGLEVSVTVSAPQAAVSGVLTVIGSGRAKESIFSATGALVDQVREREEAAKEAAEAAASAAASSTGTAGPSASASPRTGASPSAEPSESSEPSESAEASASGSATAPAVEVSTAESSVIAELPVDVPAGQTRTITIPEAAKPALLHLVWRSAEGSGPAIVSHLALDPDVPLATGYSWWPTLSAVEGIPVREDVGVLAPAG